MFSVKPTILFNQISFAWPDGSPVLISCTTAFGAGRTGLIGDNGSGKTTLLRLISGELAPTTGEVSVSGEVGCLPQHLTLGVDALVSDLLGVRAVLDALRAMESGDTDPRLYDVIGDDWDIEARAEAELSAIGLAGLTVDRRVGTLSGGEAMLVALAGLRVAGTPVVLLDEPTNNLDRQARERFQEAIIGWPGALIVVSHDVELLDLMEETVELHDGELSVFGGGYTAFAQAREQEQAAVAQSVTTAKQQLRKEQRQRREAETRLARRQRYANTDHANKRKPKIVMNTRRFQAQVAAGKLRDSLDDRVASARDTLSEQEGRLRDDERVRIELPDPQVPAGRRLAELHHAAGVHIIAGAERLAISGRNGVGKTLLLETLFDPSLQAEREVRAIPLVDGIGYLPQRLDGLTDSGSAVDAVRAAAPTTSPEQIRGQLARFLLRGDQVHRPVGTLSGGERFRVALAQLLLADPPHQLLVLDEPTNNLDLNTTQVLADALRSYRGALLIVSHDHHLLAQLNLDVHLQLDDAGALTEGAEPS